MNIEELKNALKEHLSLEIHSEEQGVRIAIRFDNDIITEDVL